MFTFLLRDLKDGAYLINTSPINIRMMFFANFVTQLVCVSGVNLLASVGPKIHCYVLEMQ